MLKVTDTAFALPLIHPLEFMGDFPSGATGPLLIRGTAANGGYEGEYVLKCVGGQGMSPGSLVRELLASFIARELELDVPQPVVIEITQPFVEIMRGIQGFQQVSRSIGLNFGCEYLKGASRLPQGQPMGPLIRKKALEILIFDAFIENIDRNSIKPNVLVRNDNVFVIDHEKAFSFVHIPLPLRPTEPWLLSGPSTTWIKRHLFFDGLKGAYNTLGGSQFVSKLGNLTNNTFWQCCLLHIPATWPTAHVQELRAYLTQIAANSLVFGQELERMLQA